MIEKQLADLWSHTLSVIRNPQASPREAVTLAGMAVVLILAILAFMSLFLVGRERPAEEEPPIPPPRRSLLVDVAVLGGVTIVIAAVLMGIFASVSASPTYCRGCHEMKRDYRSWRRSSHRTLTCANCHQEPGFFGYTSWKTRQLGMVSARLTQRYPRPISADVANSSCVQCHGLIMRNTVTVSGLRMRHSDVVEAGYKCIQCHNTVGHGKATLNAKRPTMDQCTACHDGRKAFATCSRCHVVDIGKPVSAPTAEYPPARLGPLTTCRGCHAVDKCNRCHGIEMPHPVGWLSSYRHAPAAAFERKEVCKRCHSDVYCSQCHRDFGNHGPNWKSEHGAVLAPTKHENCLACHSQTNNLCGLCHPKYRERRTKQGQERRSPGEPSVKQF